MRPFNLDEYLKDPSRKVGDNTIAVCLKGDYLLSDIIPFDESKVGKIE